jgi:FkbM family methyltransferase
MEINKNNNNFFIFDDESYTTKWFLKTIDTWENDTFHILDYYKNRKTGVYIDIGSWIGPTVIYGSLIYKRVIAIEPDPVALERLKKNISINNCNNIDIISKGLSCDNGTIEFGGNGDFGNSESTLLIANKDDYLSYSGRQQDHHHKNVVEIETITIERLIEQQNINPADISLIKIDIEGGEKIVVPALVNFLKMYKIPFYISLHYCFLRQSEIEEIIDILFGLYDNCYLFYVCGEKKLVDKDYVIKNKINCLVFE